VALTDTALLGLWERAHDQDRLDRSVTLAKAAASQPADVMSWPVGRRERALLTLMVQWGHEELDVVLTCPACEEKLETTLPVSALLALEPPPPSVDVELSDGPHTVRPVDSADLHAVRETETADEALHLLAARLLDDHQPRSPDDLAILASALEEADPLAEVRLSPACVACGAQWQATLEIVDHVWQSLTTRAQRLMHEVHLLASHYHWSEERILALTPQRRRVYLDMVLR
jgi:hypothetical protein